MPQLRVAPGNGGVDDNNDNEDGESIELNLSMSSSRNDPFLRRPHSALQQRDSVNSSACSTRSPSNNMMQGPPGLCALRVQTSTPIDAPQHARSSWQGTVGRGVTFRLDDANSDTQERDCSPPTSESTKRRRTLMPLLTEKRQQLKKAQSSPDYKVALAEARAMMVHGGASFGAYGSTHLVDETTSFGGEMFDVNSYGSDTLVHEFDYEFCECSRRTFLTSAHLLLFDASRACNKSVCE